MYNRSKALIGTFAGGDEGMDIKRTTITDAELDLVIEEFIQIENETTAEGRAANVANEIETEKLWSEVIGQMPS